AYSRLMDFAYDVAQAIEKAVPCKRVGMAVVGLEVPHVHVHLIPLQSMDDMRFEKKETLTQEEFSAVAKSINDCLDRKSTRLNSSHVKISYAVFCLKKTKSTR